MERDKWDKPEYTFSKQELGELIEWVRVNGERHRGNLQKNGIELYRQFLIEKHNYEENKGVA